LPAQDAHQLGRDWHGPRFVDESREVHWISMDQVADLQMDRSMRMRIDHYLHSPGRPHLG
jgi:hypothetical protein